MADRDITQHFPAPTRKRGAPLLLVEGLSHPPRLREVSFTLYRGEILGVAGLLGAGRTELARAIAGADLPHHGRVVLDGRPLRVRAPSDAIRAGIGLVPEDRKRHGFVPDERRGQPGPAAARPTGSSRRDRSAPRARAGNAMDQRAPDQDAQPSTRVLTLSGGNQQKVVLGKWLAAGADVLIVDEPTRGIDVAAKMEIYHLLDRLAAEGAGILMISSELPEILGMSDRVLVMHQGRLQTVLDAHEATQERVLQAALGLAS